MGIVTMTLSPPIRVFALIGALVATGLLAFVFVVGRDTSESDFSTPATPVKTRRADDHGHRRSTPRPAAVRPRIVSTKSGLPAPVDHALRYRRVVVVAVYMPRAAVDAVVHAEARAAATSSRAGFVAISALNERLVGALVAQTGVLPDPAIVIVKRPGVVTATLGVTDRETIAQAVSQARR